MFPSPATLVIKLSSQDLHWQHTTIKTTKSCEPRSYYCISSIEFGQLDVFKLIFSLYCNIYQLEKTSHICAFKLVKLLLSGFCLFSFHLRDLFCKPRGHVSLGGLSKGWLLWEVYQKVVLLEGLLKLNFDFSRIVMPIKQKKCPRFKRFWNQNDFNDLIFRRLICGRSRYNSSTLVKNGK